MRTRFIVLYLLFCIVQIFPQQDDFQKFIENKLNSRTLTTYEKINSEFLINNGGISDLVNSIISIINSCWQINHNKRPTLFKIHALVCKLIL